MNEADLRALVRDAVARHLGTGPADPPPASRPTPRPANPGDDPHASHLIYLALSSGSEACLIEPAVSCTHCGYCKTHGY